MDELLAVIAELGLELHPDRVRVVASKIEGLGSVEQFALARPAFGPNADKVLITRLGQAWHGAYSMSPRDVATALRGASATAVEQQRRGSVELAWTGPSSGQVPVRHTEQVLMEVINAAQRRLFIVSFVAYQVKSIGKALTEAVERGVQVDVLLESSIAHGGKVDHDSVEAMRKLVPSARLFAWSAPRRALETSIPVWSMRSAPSPTVGSLSSRARISPLRQWSGTWSSEFSSRAGTSLKSFTITLRR